jgi:hypothetical protein
MDARPERHPEAAVHAEALAALRRAARRLGPVPQPSALPDAVEREAAAGGADPARVLAQAHLYLYGARVGGAAATDPEVAGRWLRGWASARARTPDEARAALAAAIAFAERVHRALGLRR